MGFFTRFLGVDVMLENQKYIKVNYPGKALLKAAGLTLNVNYDTKMICVEDSAISYVEIPFKDLLGADIEVNGTNVTSYDSILNRALVGGLLFGTTGAIICGSTGSVKSRMKIDSAYLVLNVNNPNRSIIKMPLFMNIGTNYSDDINVQNVFNATYDAIDILDEIMRSN